MTARHQKMFMAPEHRRALLAHDRKYQITAVERRRLRIALQTLADHEEAVALAMNQLSLGAGVLTVQQMMGMALRILVEGPNGEFR